MSSKETDALQSLPATFCVLPWAHLATLTDGSIIPCCIAQNEGKMNLHDQTVQQAWNSEYMRGVRLKMLKGEAVSACQHCYVEEKNGYRSHRITELAVWSKKMGPTFIPERIAATEVDGTLNEDLVSIDLRIGNTCNLQCVMCRPADSSKWKALSLKLAEALEHPELKEDWRYKSQIDHSRFNWYESPRFLEAFKELAPYLRELIIGGGEPMILNEHRWLIETCVASGAASQIQLRYHTNATVLPEELFPLWEKFKLVELFLSIDAVGEKNGYLRYPASWHDVSKNLKRIDDHPSPNIQAMILLSVHALSMYNLPDFSQWIEEQNFKKVTHKYNGYFHPGVVHYPPYLSVQVYPQHIKEKIAARIRAFEARSKKPSVKLEGVINFMFAHDATDRLPQMREYVQKLDRFRQTEFKALFPELSQDLGWS